MTSYGMHGDAWALRGFLYWIDIFEDHQYSGIPRYNMGMSKATEGKESE